MILNAAIPKRIRTLKRSFVLIVWGGRNLDGYNGDNTLLAPGLTLSMEGMKEFVVVPPLGWVNRGVGAINMPDQIDRSLLSNWSIGAMLGKLPPGDFSANLVIKVLPDKSVLYDGIQVFIIRAA